MEVLSKLVTLYLHWNSDKDFEIVRKNQNVQVRKSMGQVISTIFVSETIMCKIFGISLKQSRTTEQG